MKRLSINTGFFSCLISSFLIVSFLTVSILIFSAQPSPVHASGARIKGDIDNSGVIDLGDAVLALQVLVGIASPDDVHLANEVNGDNKIGIEEVIYILQVVAELRDVRPPSGVRVEVTPENGGYYKDPTTGMSIDIPAGAVENEMVIRVVAAPDLEAKPVIGVRKAHDHLFHAWSAYRFEPSGAVFSKPLTVTVPFETADEPYKKGFTTAMLLYNENTQSWGLALDGAGNVIMGTAEPRCGKIHYKLDNFSLGSMMSRGGKIQLAVTGGGVVVGGLGTGGISEAPPGFNPEDFVEPIPITEPEDEDDEDKPCEQDDNICSVAIRIGDDCYDFPTGRVPRGYPCTQCIGILKYIVPDETPVQGCKKCRNGSPVNSCPCPPGCTCIKELGICDPTFIVPLCNRLFSMGSCSDINNEGFALPYGNSLVRGEVPIYVNLPVGSKFVINARSDDGLITETWKGVIEKPFDKKFLDELLIADRTPKGNACNWNTGLTAYTYGDIFGPTTEGRLGRHTLQLDAITPDGRTVRDNKTVYVANVATFAYGGAIKSSDGIVRLDIPEHTTERAFHLMSVEPAGSSQKKTALYRILTITPQFPQPVTLHIDSAEYKERRVYLATKGEE